MVAFEIQNLKANGFVNFDIRKPFLDFSLISCLGRQKFLRPGCNRVVGITL